MNEDNEHVAIWKEIAEIRTDISKISNNLLQMTKVLADFLSRHDKDHLDLGEGLRALAISVDALNTRIERLHTKEFEVRPDS